MSPANPYVKLSGMIFLALLVAACKPEAAAKTTDPARPVQVQRVGFETTENVREFVGVVRARYEIDLAFRVGGKIIERAVSVGDRVAAGDVIARLDPQDLKLQVDSAEAALASARSGLTQAVSDFERYAALRKRGFATVADYDRKKAAKDEAAGRHEQALRAFELARNQLAYAELRADADGVVTATPGEPGQVVAAGQPVIRFAHSSEKEVAVSLPETWLAEVRKAAATVRLWSDERGNFRAQLRELAPQADPATRTYAARFTILDPDNSVALGMTAIVALSRSADRRVARLPLSAILSRGTGPTVYVVNEFGQAEERPVAVSAFLHDAALVTSGVSEGDLIVTLGVQKLVAGEKVRPVEGR